MASPYIVTRGIVLRETVTKESDKILTLLTEDRGKASVIARGVRRKNCKYAAAAQTLAWSEWTLYQRGEWYHANEGTALELFEGVRGDLDAYALACFFAELTEAVSPEEVPSVDVLRHLLNGLYALSALHKPPELVKPVFQLKLLGLAGYEPLLDACAFCGAEDPAEPYLDVVQGVLRCKTCGREVRSRAVPLGRDALAAARHTLYGDPRKLYAVRLGGDALRRLDSAADALLSAQLERRFQTLEFYRSLRAAPDSGGAAPTPPDGT